MFICCDEQYAVKQLKELLDIGAITEEEYKQEKEKHSVNFT